MSNRILDVHIEPRSLDPVAAELIVRVRPERLTDTTEVRGRLIGPSCPYSSTVELAYPLRAEKGAEKVSGTVFCRVVIPEASLWDPQSPFLYAGPVELWQDEQCCDRVQVSYGLRHFNVGHRGLRINGKLVTLNGCEVESLDEASARRLREEGRNLLVVPLREDTLRVWDEADRWGFLVVGRVEDGEHAREWQDRLQQRASSLGWLRPGEEWQHLYG